MLMVRRILGVLLVAAALAIWFGMAPQSHEAKYKSDIETALISDQLNNQNTEGAAQQQVVNGWTAKDLLTVLARQGAQPADERPAALLFLAVLGIAFFFGTSSPSRATSAVASAPEQPREPSETPIDTAYSRR